MKIYAFYGGFYDIKMKVLPFFSPSSVVSFMARIYYTKHVPWLDVPATAKTTMTTTHKLNKKLKRRKQPLNIVPTFD